MGDVAKQEVVLSKGFESTYKRQRISRRSSNLKYLMSSLPYSKIFSKKLKYSRMFEAIMNAVKRTFVTLIVLLTFILILSVLYTPIEKIKANATLIGRCPQDLTGKWNGNDGGTYWIRQERGAVMWFGTSGLQEGTPFSNVFHGVRNGDTITGKWADIPMGKIMQQGEISFTCTQEGGIDKLKRKSQTGGFGGTEFSKLNHILVNLPTMKSGSCQMTAASLALFPGGHALWRAVAFSEDEDDAWVIRNLVMLDKSGKLLHVFPKFSSKTLPTGVVSSSINFVANLPFPASIFNSIGSVKINQASC